MITSKRLLRVESNEVGNNLRRWRLYRLKGKKNCFYPFAEWADLVTFSERFQVGSSLLICYPTLIVFEPKQAFVYVRDSDKIHT